MIELLLVVAVILVVSAMAVPNVFSMMRSLRIAGDARSIAGLVGQAKMRAAADFTQARLYVDLSANTFRLDVWDKASSAWTTEGGTNLMSQNVTPSFGTVASPPANTQAAIGQAPACRLNTGSGNTIANTACVVFNSRGIPVDNTGAATPNDAIYVTDGSTVYGVTVNSMGLIQTWRTDANSSSWQKR